MIIDALLSSSHKRGEARIGTMVLLEARVHQILKDWLGPGSLPTWPHHLTMGRLVSRSLRLRRSALIQTGSLPARYSASYLLPCLLSGEAVQVVATAPRQKWLLDKEIPQLLTWLGAKGLALDGSVRVEVLNPEQWFTNRLATKGAIVADPCLTLIEQVECLEKWLQDFLTLTWTPDHWQELMTVWPGRGEIIRQHRIQLTKSLFSRPPNPYDCYLLNEDEQDWVQTLLRNWEKELTTLPALQKFWHFWQVYRDNHLLWATVNRNLGHFTLHLGPVNLAPLLAPCWRSPLILMGGILDVDKAAVIFRRTLGLGEMLCLKFMPQRVWESLQIYLPDRLPTPNTREFQTVLLEQLHQLLSLEKPPNFSTVILLDDVPLKTSLGSRLAAEFGSRVKVENLALPKEGILICSWDFWRNYQHLYPEPGLLIFATLPIPSLENPLVNSRVNYHKRHHQDWFRSYLLPTALQAIQVAILPLCEGSRTVAILDGRVNSRSYGSQILAVLEPYAKRNYLSPNWFLEVA